MRTGEYTRAAPPRGVAWVLFDDLRPLPRVDRAQRVNLAQLWGARQEARRRWHLLRCS